MSARTIEQTKSNHSSKKTLIRDFLSKNKNKNFISNLPSQELKTAGIFIIFPGGTFCAGAFVLALLCSFLDLNVALLRSRSRLYTCVLPCFMAISLWIYIVLTAMKRLSEALKC